MQSFIVYHLLYFIGSLKKKPLFALKQNQTLLMTVRKRGDSHFTHSTFVHTIPSCLQTVYVHKVCYHLGLPDVFFQKALFSFLVLNYLFGNFSQQLLPFLVFHSSSNKMFHPYPIGKLEGTCFFSHGNILMLISLRKAPVFALKSFNWMEESPTN